MALKLFLTGGGDQESFKKIDQVFLKNLKPDSQVALLAHACEDQQEALERIVYYFERPPISQIDLIKKPSEEILNYDALMIEGGNTFELIQQMRESSFFNLIKKFIDLGKPIYADSAGAIILGRDVHTAFLGDDGDDDQLRLQDYRGLGVLGDWCLHAHSTEDDYEQLQDLLYDKGWPILALSEEASVFINKDEVEVLGPDDLWVIDFEGQKKIPPGQKIVL
ncbi:MAG: hypothetical protein CME66_10260 [Halobacteriovoraceae bacterium]|nr:hypothetical protein [Halobacteriovoraceae bacterium]